jgi:hypothetical protein
MIVLLFYLFWGVLFRSIGTIYLYNMDESAFATLYPNKRVLIGKFLLGVIYWPYTVSKGIITLVNVDLWR